MCLSTRYLSNFNLLSTHSFIQSDTNWVLDNILMLRIQRQLAHLIATPNYQALFKELMNTVMLFIIFLNGADTWNKVIIILI